MNEISLKGICLRWVLICVAVLAGVCGCDRKGSTDEEFIRKASIKSCEELLRNPRVSKDAKAIVESVLEKRKNNVLDLQPVIAQASLAQPRSKESACLAIWMSDGDGDTEGIVIRESEVMLSREGQILEEVYPVFAHQDGRIAHTYVIPVRVRRDNERKDESAWKWFLGANIGEIKYIPDIWVSDPNCSNRKVEVWVYDRAGHKSQAVPVVSYLDCK